MVGCLGFRFSSDTYAGINVGKDWGRTHERDALVVVIMSGMSIERGLPVSSLEAPCR